VGSGPVASGVTVSESRRTDPCLEGLLVLPSGHDQPLVASVGGAKKLETLETWLAVHRPGASSEPAGQFVSGVLRDGYSVDLDYSHANIMSYRDFCPETPASGALLPVVLDDLTGA